MRDAMLAMTVQRDRQHLHDVIPGEATQRGTTFFIPLETTEQTSVDQTPSDQIPSDQIVNYPSGGKGGQQSNGGADRSA